MRAFRYAFAALLLAALSATAVRAQVVETDPDPVREDQPVTLFFNADEGDGGLADFDGDVYLYSGIFTTSSPEAWTCIQADFSENTPEMQVERVEENRYAFEIEDIRAFYQDTAQECLLGEDDRILSLNLVFRSADASQQSEDLFVDVLPPQTGDPSVSISLTEPTGTTPLYPAFAPDGSTLRIEAEAVTGGGAEVESFRVLVDGEEVAEAEDGVLMEDVALGAPGVHTVELVATAGDDLEDRVEFEAFQVAAVEDAPLPAGVEDGITYNSTSSATLVLRAPFKDFSFVIGDFSGWDASNEYLMKRAYAGTDSTRYWLRLDGLPAGSEVDFQYFVDGTIRVSDPYAEKVRSPNDQFISNDTYPGLQPYPDGETEHLVSVLRLGQEAFDFSGFERPAQKDLVIYELLIRDFIEAHDYETMADTLDYFTRLGVTAIELMPVSEFDGNESWGYNPNHYFAPDKYYGPEEDLKAFIEAAHERGIAIILDVVYNQQTGQAPFVRLYNDPPFGPPTDENIWVNREAKHPFNVFNDNNHESAATQYWLDRVNRHWLTEYNVDGFRFDLSKGFTQGPNDEGYGDDVAAWSSFDAERVALLKRMADQIWATDDDAYIILEHFAVNEEEQELVTYRRDAGLPGMMVWQNLNSAYNQLSMGYQENSNISSSYAPNRDLPVTGPVTYMESHDEQWMMYRNIAFGNSSEDGDYDVTEFETAFNRQKLAGAFFFTVPGPRMMWQFGELGYGFGEDGTQCLREADCPAGTPGRTAPKPIRWDYFEGEDRRALYDTWAAMINLRLDNDLFTSTETTVAIEDVEGGFARSITLTNGDVQAVVLGNFDVDSSNVGVSFPAGGTWYDYFPGGTLDISSTDTSFAYAPGEFHIYTNQDVGTPQDGLVPFGPTSAPQQGPPPPFEPPTDVAAQIDQSFGGDLTREENYRLVALPGTAVRALGSNVPGVAGEDWQGYWDNGESSNFFVRFQNGDDTFRYRPGRGFWLISRGERTVSQTLDAVELTEDGTYAIPLHGGWNIISNPFGADVPWADVQALNGGASQPLWAWSGGFGQTNTFGSAADGEAFYFLNESGLDSLTVAYPGSPSDPDAAAADRPAFMLTATVDGQRASTVRVGFADEAATGRDRFDQPAPPSRFAPTSLRLTSTALATERATRGDGFAAEFRPSGGEGHAFDLTLRTDIRRPVTLRAGALAALAGQEVRLLNRATAKAYDLRAQPSVTIEPAGEATALTLVVGSRAFVEQTTAAAVPEAFRVKAPYPNPFRQQATLEYSLPEASHVQIEVFDVLGRRVRTLADEQRAAGFHTTTLRARGLASGVYFYRVTAGEQTETGRMVLVR